MAVRLGQGRATAHRRQFYWLKGQCLRLISVEALKPVVFSSIRAGGTMLFSYFFLPDFSSRVHVNQPSKRLIVFMTFVTHKNHTVIIIPLKKKKGPISSEVKLSNQFPDVLYLLPALLLHYCSAPKTSCWGDVVALMKPRFKVVASSLVRFEIDN